MASRRTLKAAAAVREVVSMAILADLKDPRVRNVTVTFVEVTPDMRQAKVHVSVMGNETQQQLTLRGLQNAAGYLQSKLSNRIETRYTPRLEFVLDQGVKQSIEISKILQRVLPADEESSAEESATAGDAAEDHADADEEVADEDDAADDDADDDEVADDDHS
ncbi:MAG: 30S ribosome-binding factor RbfA [Planctomycetaceae bacterium]|nr:30S ribosome-binding factor RbfA [Planctomycetaceae bacterium]